MNEKTGTIVATSQIKIDSVAVAHGNLTVSIVNSLNVSQPNPGTGNTILASGVAQVPVTVGSNIVYIDPSTGNTVLLPPNQAPPAGYQVQMQNAGQSAPGATVANGPAANALPQGGQGGGPIVAGGPATAITGATTLNVQEEQKNLVVFNDLPTVQDVAAALNALGVTPRDMMAIFQEMKEAGALQAELVVH
jgi:flagellar P-ring protein precursor FlgI